MGSTILFFNFIFFLFSPGEKYKICFSPNLNRMKKLVCLASLMLLLTLRLSYATHIVGADITYKHISGNRYEFTLDIYRDCAGQNVASQYQIDYGSISCNIQNSFRVNPVHKEEISPVCPTRPSICQGGQEIGIERHVYKGIVDLPSQCADWVFSWSRLDEFRNASITNIVNPQTTGIYIEARLNNLRFENNNSPEFGNMPVSFITLNESSYLSPGVREEDGDRITYKTITPRSKKNGLVEYKPPFNATNPLTSSPAFSIDPQSGAIAISPTREETSVTAILVEEYRDGELIGSVMRDIQLIARDLSNANPILNPQVIEICAGEEACMQIKASDPDGQEVKLSWNFGIPGARFTAGAASTNPEGEFCWDIPRGTTGGSYYFTVTAEDNNCPIVGQTTVTYEIKVNALPRVSLPASEAIPCNTTKRIVPTITRGLEPYTYLWSTGERDPTITKGAGYYYLHVTDANGCTDSSDIFNMHSSAEAAFSFPIQCANDYIPFTDQSTSSNGTIVKWNWDFGDPESHAENTSTLQHPTHVFTKGGSFDVTLDIEDSEGCKSSITKTVKVCDKPEVDFVKLDSCKHKPLYILDASTAEICGIKEYHIQVNGQTVYLQRFGTGYPRPIYFPGDPGYLTASWVPSDTGWHSVTVTITNEYNCKSSLSKDIYIYDNPYGRIFEPSSYYNCDNPRNVFHLIDTAGGTSPVKYIWSTGLRDVDSLVVEEIDTIAVRIYDSLGCDTIIYRYVMDPLETYYVPTLYCNENDSLLFTEKAFSHWGVEHWSWDFGNGEIKDFTANGKSVKYRYPLDGVYKATLTIRDRAGCEGSYEHEIKQVLPEEHFVVDPTILCSYDLIKLESPRGQYIDSLIWKVNDKVIVRADNDSSSNKTVRLKRNADGEFYFDQNYRFPVDSAGKSHVFSLHMMYNRLLDRDTLSCERVFKDTVDIFEHFAVNPELRGGCADDTLTLASSLLSGKPVSTLVWRIERYDHSHGPGGDHYELFDEFSKDTIFFLSEPGQYKVTYSATNEDGCVFSKSEMKSIGKMPDPIICPDNLCATRETYFFYTCQEVVEGMVDDIFWDFGDPFADPENQTSTGLTPFHIYSREGSYNVRVELINNTYNCRRDTTMPIYIYPLPQPDFTAIEPVCVGQPVYFFDQSKTLVDGSSIDYLTWILNEGDTSYARDPIYTYEHEGSYDVKLYVVDSVSQCADTVTKTVVVNPVPSAGFHYIENNLISGRPIQFFDESMGAIRWLWIWGDGDSLTIADPAFNNPEHTYPIDFQEAPIQQIAYNEFGCSDTARKSLDLKVYLLLPTAFSPNSDGINDGLHLFYKGIEELLEFRVYNRWGELVFDGGDDLNAVWDGTFRGSEQPIGSYVYYIKARDYHQQIITHSGKIALIR